MFPDPMLGPQSELQKALCSRCGATYAETEAEGHCPVCLMACLKPELIDGVGDDEDETIPQPFAVASAADSTRWEPPAPAELAGLIPGYEFQAFLGRGGMGAVYKGTQLRLQRPVAIKMMRRGAGGPVDFEARFEREAKSMAKLHHPNIVSVFDYGEAGAHYLYIAMELVDGADLMSLIHSGSVTQELALNLLPQICDALQYAHDHGIVHRDIKPGNIMITRGGQVKVADFGLARSLDALQGSETIGDARILTPDYAAPEQFDPQATVDHRADIYALGVMIYQMITGQLPRGAWKAPSQRAAVTARWDGIVSKALQTDPDERHQSASEVKTEVAFIHAGVLERGAHEAPPTGDKSTAGFRPGRRWLYVLVLLSLSALGLALLLPGWRSPPTQNQEHGSVDVAVPQPASPTVVVASDADDPLARASKEKPFINTLGMKFVPVPGTRVLMCIHETRRQDYAAYAQTGSYIDASWQDPKKGCLPYGVGQPYPAIKVKWPGSAEVHLQGDEKQHPVSNVMLKDAFQFCSWLAQKEKKHYRLPTDQEWSMAVGIGDTESFAPGTSPSSRGATRSNLFPWGPDFPPKSENRDGNYRDEAFHRLFIDSTKATWLAGYDDGYPVTAPVMSFKPNKLGLFDMGGNLSEWIADMFATPDRPFYVTRGCDWFYTTKLARYLDCSERQAIPIESFVTEKYRTIGFRCVIETKTTFAK